MALFGLFSRDPKAAVEKQSKRLMNKYQQTAERKAAIDALARIGTEDAVLALLKRYQFQVEQSISDEDEKNTVYEVVVALGPKAVDGVKQYIRTEVGLYWAVKALRALVGEAETATVLIEALDGFTNTLGQNRERRQQLVDNLRNFASDDRVFERLLQLVHDEDEEVVVRAVDGLSAREGHTDQVVDALAAVAVSERTSPRIRMMIFELMVNNGWKTTAERVPELTTVVTSQYVVDPTGSIRRK